MNAQADRPDPDEPEKEQEASEDTAAEGEESTEPDVVAELTAKAEENWNKYLRAAAEVENTRKRAARDVENAHKFALERFASELLAVRDSLEMGLSMDPDADAASLREGSEATLRQLTAVMERFGVEELDPHGEPFDPDKHEAMTMQPSEDTEPGSVLSVYQKGYALNGRLLRPARVVVAAAPEDEAKKG